MGASKRVRLIAASCLVTALSCAPLLCGKAAAASITAKPLGEDKSQAIISIVGEISQGDAERLRRVALSNRAAVVWLSSNGGQTMEAIEMGKIIRLQGYDTYVSTGGPCNSACALVWLSGNRRFIDEGARVGFHASYVEDGGNLRESGVGNAIVGNYLSQLNLSERAIVFATSASPNSLNWLTPENAAGAGIEVRKIGGDTSSGERAETSTDTQATELFKQVAGWQVRVDPTLGRGCFIYSTWEGGVALRIGIDRRDPPVAYMMLFGESWNSVAEGREYDVAIRFGNLQPWTAKAVGTDMGGLKGITVRVGDLNFFNEFAKQPNVLVSYKDRDAANLKLPQSQAALAAMVDCQQAQNLRASDPFK